MRVRDAVTVADVERIARRRIPRVIYDTLAGGAGDEVSLRANRAAFERITFVSYLTLDGPPASASTSTRTSSRTPSPRRGSS